MHILFVVTEDWYFCSHRLNLAKAAITAGFKVSLATRVQEHGEVIKEAGIRLIPLQYMNRKGMNPLGELKCILELMRIYRETKPDIVHHVAMKPMLYGSIAAFFARVPYKVQAISGFGFVFLSDSFKAKLLRVPIRLMLRFALCGKQTDVIVQNPDDAALAEQIGVQQKHLHVIAGSGVDIDKFHPVAEPESNEIKVTLVARMLWDKGIEEFVEAIHLLKGRGLNIQACLVGEPDESNPASISLAQLQTWQEDAGIHYAGRRSDIAQVWAESNIAVLPSYREGLPKSLLEAAACGRAMVATDVPGCRSVVIHKKTGLLVPVKNAELLADAIAYLMKHPLERKEMGRSARVMVENTFSDDCINSEIIDLYKGLDVSR